LAFSYLLLCRFLPQQFRQLEAARENSTQAVSPVVQMIPAAVDMKETDGPGNLYALSAVLMDGDSGRVLYEKEGYTARPNASTTKVMTCILAWKWRWR